MKTALIALGAAVALCGCADYYDDYGYYHGAYYYNGPYYYNRPHYYNHHYYNRPYYNGPYYNGPYYDGPYYQGPYRPYYDEGQQYDGYRGRPDGEGQAAPR